MKQEKGACVVNLWHQSHNGGAAEKRVNKEEPLFWLTDNNRNTRKTQEKEEEKKTMST